jgi:carbonic anhydrase
VVTQLPRRPARRLAMLACMDSRLDLFELLGLDPGEAHLIRNAGGIVTPDVLRSLAMSQRLLDTEDVIVLQHTDCGMERFDDAAFRAGLAEETGVEPPWSSRGFDDVDASARETAAALLSHPLLRCRQVTAFVYDTAAQELRQVV